MPLGAKHGLSPLSTRARDCPRLSSLGHHQQRAVHARPQVRCHSSGFRDPNVREAAKRLTQLFYTGSTDVGAPATAAPAPSHPNPSFTTSTSFTSYPSAPDLRIHSPHSPAAPPPLPAVRDLSHVLSDLPLWRADSVVLVGQQALLHIHSPHYVHMFDSLFARGPGPWLFGHVRLPAGSRNLGAPEWSLAAPSSAAPRVGALMEVHRAVRLEDGKLMVLATALSRIRVLRCRQETPYTRAAVALLHEPELLEPHTAHAVSAALQSTSVVAASTSVPVPVPVSAAAATAGTAVTPGGAVAAERGAARPGVTWGADGAMRAAAAAAQAAANAADWHWHGFEAGTARAGAWPGRCPAEGIDPADTQRLVTELVSHGVLNVVPLPDGPVAGRWDLAALARAAAAAAATAAEAAVTAAQREARRQEGCDVAGDAEAAVLWWDAREGPTGGAGGGAAAAGSGWEGGAAAGMPPGGSLVERLFAEGTPGAGWAREVRRSFDESVTGPIEIPERRPPKDAAAIKRPAAPPSPQSEPGRQALQQPLEATHGQVPEPAPHSAASPSAPSPAAPDAPGRSTPGMSSPVRQGPSKSTAPSASSSSSSSSSPPPAPAPQLPIIPPDLVEGLTGHTHRDLLLLEARLWRELDSLAELTARVHGRPLGLPLGLLQLRPSDEHAAAQLAAAQLAAAGPPPPQPTAQGASAEPATDGKDNEGVSSADGTRQAGGQPAQQLLGSTPGAAPARGSVAPRLHPASEGLDVYAHPDYPLERRTRRLSYAVAGIFLEGHDAAARQAVLECPSVRQRLIAVLWRAREEHRELAALAAVKGLWAPGK